jgi:hypothetical protein
LADPSSLAGDQRLSCGGRLNTIGTSDWLRIVRTGSASGRKTFRESRGERMKAPKSESPAMWIIFVLVVVVVLLYQFYPAVMPVFR